MIVAFVSLIIVLLHEPVPAQRVVVQGQAFEAGETVVEDIEAEADEVEAQLVEVEEEQQETEAAKAGEHETARLTPDD
jgi:hypothetical protein